MTTTNTGTKGSETQTVTICRTVYRVERNPDRPGQYILTGPRGTQYGTMRNVHRPDQMFLVGSGAYVPGGRIGAIWLTDRNGALEVI